MNQTVLLIGLLMLLGCVALGFMALIAYTNQQNRAWINRLHSGTSKGRHHSSSTGPSQGLLRFLGILESLGQSTKPNTAAEISHIRSLLIVAGYRSFKAPLLFWGSRLLMGVLIGFFALLLPVPPEMATLAIQAKLFYFFGGGLLGLYLPNVWIRLKIKNRQRQIREGFPDILDLLVVCVEAGLGLDAAIARVSSEIQSTYPVICKEFEVLALELRIGLTREEALRNLDTRIGLEEVHQLTALLIQSDELGSSIAKALKVHAEFMRKKRHARAEELAAKIPVKLTLPLIFFIFPSLFIVLLGPAGIQVAEVFFPALQGK